MRNCAKLQRRRRHTHTREGVFFAQVSSQLEKRTHKRHYLCILYIFDGLACKSLVDNVGFECTMTVQGIGRAYRIEVPEQDLIA